MQRSLRAILAALVCTCLFVSSAFAQCVDGSITSALQTSGPFAGLWKYTLTVSWDLPQGLSNIAMQCEWECEGICQAGWAFESPAGTGDGIASDGGTPGECTVPFAGMFDCMGTPSQGLIGPTVKWDALDNIDPENPCEAGPTGMATVCFYVDLPPHASDVPLIVIKNGQQVCTGTIAGQCPSCPVSVEESVWGDVKVRYRD